MAVVRVEGLAEFRKQLRELEDGKVFGRALAKGQREVAKKAAGWAQSEARGMGGAQAKFAKRIAGRATQAGARIEISKQEANAAFWGAKKRTGWFGHGRYRGLDSQHDEWVGASWDVAARGEGPYAINRALADNLDEILDLYDKAMDDVWSLAFPD